MEHEVVSTSSSHKQEFEDLAVVIKGAGFSLQLSEYELFIVLLRLLTCSKQITATILKESTCVVCDDNYQELSYICVSYSNLKLAIQKIVQLYQHRNRSIRDTLIKLFNTRLYMALNYIALFISEKHATRSDLRPLRAGQVFVLIVDAIDIIQTNVYNPNDKTTVTSHYVLETKTTEMLEVVNIAINRLENTACSHANTDARDLKNAATILNIIHRLVVHPGFKNLRDTEKKLLRTLVHQKLSMLQARLQGLLRPSSYERDKSLLCKIANAALSRYEMAVNSIHKPQPYSSLAFTLVRSLALAFEVHKLLFEGKSPFFTKEEKEHVHVNTANKICNKVYLSITTYLRQLVRQSDHYKVDDPAYYGTALNYIEDALQKTRVLGPKIGADNVAVTRHVRALKKSLEESVELLTYRLQQKKTDATDTLHTLSRIDELVVLDSFYPNNGKCPSVLLESVAEEMWLQGRGGGKL